MNLLKLVKIGDISIDPYMPFMTFVVLLCKMMAIAYATSLSNEKSHEFYTIPKELIPKGNVVDSVCWQDKAGNHIVFISYYTAGDVLEPGYVAELNAIQIDIKNQ